MKKIFNIKSVIIGGEPTINGIFDGKNLADEINILLYNSKSNWSFPAKIYKTFFRLKIANIYLK